MTELETFISWLERQNKSLRVEPEENFTFVSVEAGYSGFVSILSFDKEGKFFDIGAYE